MHGGTSGGGAPKGNKNALKDGLYTKRQKEWRDFIRELFKDDKKMREEFLSCGF